MHRSPIMYHDGSVWRNWECYNSAKGNIAILVGGGPSLNKIDIDKLSGPGKTVFGLNTTYPHVRPDIWIGMDDPSCYDRKVFYEPFPKIMRGNYYDRFCENTKVTSLPNVLFASVKKTKRKSDLFYSIKEDTDAFIWHENVFATALNILLYMGFKKIYLAGVDFSLDEKSYFHDDIVLDDRKKAWNRNLYDSLYKYTEWLHQTGGMCGIELCSISPDSKINNFMPYISIEALNNSLDLPKDYKLLHSSELYESKQKVLNIMTTATPRKELHKKGLYKTLLELSELNLKIDWFVNIDCPKMFTAEELKSSVEGFKGLSELLENVTLHLNINVESPSFKTSSVSLFESCAKNINSSNENLFMWLEDDWRLEKPKEFKSLLDNKPLNTLFILGGATNYVSGNPFIFTERFFYKIVRMQRTEDLIDPELRFMEAKKRIYGDSELRVPLKDSVLLNAFVDIGRAWRKEKNIIKENKYSKNTKTWIKEDAGK